MSSQVIPVEPFDYIVFGGTGDLAMRKLLPALYRRHHDKQIIGASRIIATSRSDITPEDYRARARNALEQFVAERDEASVEHFLQRLDYVSTDAQSDRGWDQLAAKLQDGQTIRAFYLSVSPGLYHSICQRIAAFGLIHEQTRVVLEKPIGTDSASATVVNDAVGAVFEESQIYRIDHYLGKETVQNLMALRFANIFYEPLWNARYIDHVQITAAEDLGVGSRVGYYNGSGAMRDMVQNHLLQLLCLIAMEPPSSMHANAVRDEKLKVLQALRPLHGAEVTTNTVRGQYTAGNVGGESIPGYTDELEHHSLTETFVALRASVDNWRWAGVPFYLRTGKRLATRVSEIVVRFRDIPHSIFSDEPITPNQLTIRVQPDEHIEQMMMIKDPGPGGFRMRQMPLDMNMSVGQGAVHNPDAYERLLLDVVRGNPTLFMRRDEVEAAWAWVDPIMHAWREEGYKPIPYQPGSWGPEAAEALLREDARSWNIGE